MAQATITVATSVETAKVGERNPITVTCDRCQQEAAPRRATCTSNYGGRQYWECLTCRTKREQEEQETRNQRTREGQLLLKLVPTLDKVTDLVRDVEWGANKYNAVAHVQVNGHWYSVTVNEEDDIETRTY